MMGTLFEDLVVSAPPAGRFGRRAALLPLSIAAHGAALALALPLPVLRSGELPTPTGPTVRLGRRRRPWLRRLRCPRRHRRHA